MIFSGIVATGFTAAGAGAGGGVTGAGGGVLQPLSKAKATEPMVNQLWVIHL
jgi:hypothetical protein